MDASETVRLRQRVNVRNLSCIAYGNGFTQWHYRAEHLADTVADDFFADAMGREFFGVFSGKEGMRPGDHILVSANDGGAYLYMDKGGRVRVMAVTGYAP